MSFHVPFMFLSCSFHVPFMLHSCLFMFLSFACIFLSFCIHFLSFRFQGYGNGFMAWPEDRVQQMVIAKLSPNNPTTYDTVRRNFPQNDRGRERERGEKTRERERKRVCELDTKWHDTVTAGNMAPQVEFPLSVLPVGYLLGLRQV